MNIISTATHINNPSFHGNRLASAGDAGASRDVGVSQFLFSDDFLPWVGLDACVPSFQGDNMDP